MHRATHIKIHVYFPVEVKRFSDLFRKFLEHTQPFTEWVPGALSPG
jgi:hypothetical protein